MKLDFIGDLNESSQYRTRDSFKSTNAREIANHAFLDMLTLWILYNEFDFAPIAVKYAAKTTMYGDFARYSQAGTDMYMAFYVLSSADADIIFGDGADQLLLDRIKIDVPRIKNVLTKIRHNNLQDSTMRPFLQDLERKLLISDSGYKSVRRLVQDWRNLNEQQRALAVTRLIQFYRTHARRSELFAFLQDYARTKKLEIRNAHNAEKPKSKTTKTIAQAAALGAIGYAGFAAGRSIGRGLV